MIKKFENFNSFDPEFESIRWYYKGKFEKDDNDIPDTEFEIGKRVSAFDKNTYWFTKDDDGDINMVGKVGEWISMMPILRNDLITDVHYIVDADGYTGYVIKVGMYWPWFQTTNIEVVE